MEVLVGSALGIEVSSATAFVRERAAAAAAAARAGDDPETGFGAGRSAKPDEEDDDVDDSSSAKSSSIGAPDDSDDDDEEEDGVASSEDAAKGKGGFGSFGSLASLEDSLPIKRGLSNHFSGKSKSFNNLSEANLTEVVGSAKDLEKPEHPFNKKRRILRWSKNFPFLPTARSMPLFPLSEEEDDDAGDHLEADHDGDGEEDDGDGERGKAAVAAASRFSGRQGRKHSVFKSSSCFALSDLHEEDEEEDDDDDDEGN
ncbi:hypothetical protein BT93_H0897 [Corymbia citriodora subsp. variegata]|nr:hypothetical protein BT93_H0897 [Corymbia citriodora subsp. variegata]